MTENPIYIGNALQKAAKLKIEGRNLKIDGDEFYEITNYDQMPPFFMSIVSDSDHWLFISSNGALTAGRKNSENSLFPYYTDDKIQDSPEITGSKTIVLVEKNGKKFLWEPFSDKFQNIYSLKRNLYKNTYGNKIIFEETNNDLSLTFQYGWFYSDKYGFIKKSKIVNNNNENVSIDILDGIQNILPYGVENDFQNAFSTLVDAYKKNELQPDSGLGLYSLSSIPVDKAEPSEALKTTTVWSIGLKNSKKLVSSLQLNNFRKGVGVEQEIDIRAARGAYFINAQIDLQINEQKEWRIVAEVNQDICDVAAITKMLKEDSEIITKLNADIAKGTENLVKIVANADGLQLTADKLSSSRHFANTMFNVMRGGIFDDNYNVEKTDFLKYVKTINKVIAKEFAEFFDKFPATINYIQLLAKAAENGNPSLIRLCYDYMPLTFSRRHGDPSRPWNKFSIETKNEDGSKILYYQGNWRDIFQNWEALCFSFPGYIESIICKFVNASTADGYNPYRITRNGIDWEIIDPSEPWSNIGYWGDHQIIYLLKLLELSKNHHPGKLDDFLTKDIFAYANVPYRIKSYRQLLKDPHNTIDFDDELDAAIAEKVKEIGADAKLMWNKDGGVYHVNLTEKLLVTLLSKISNFIPEAGIWMNTQRPEWNDANNALVGYGVSMVTLYYIRRYLTYCTDLFKASETNVFSISTEVAEKLNSISDILTKYTGLLDGKISDKDRKTITDELGLAGNTYRQKIYSNGFSEKREEVSTEQLLSFFETTSKHIDHTIKANKRNDNLYHSYNLMKVENDNEISVRNLYEMLEGQVAVLGSGYLQAEESIEVLEALKSSSMFREDQYTYTLYPDRELARFVDRNNIPNNEFDKSDLLKKLIADGDATIVNKDVQGQYHFNGAFRNAILLKVELEKLVNTTYKELVEKDMQLILDIFERIFDHQSFTGRSGTFYGYEGLGSIYWHMVSKLLVSCNEIHSEAMKNNATDDILAKCTELYYDVRKGLGTTKSPEVYGAFPTDPYSHTPGNAGAQQPGMTGQVKEDFITRIGELGVVVEDGKISFKSCLLKATEFLPSPETFVYYNADGAKQSIELATGTLGFTYCQIPIIYTNDESNKVVISYSNGETTEINNLEIDTENSKSIFNKSGQISRIDVFMKPSLD